MPLDRRVEHGGLPTHTKGRRCSGKCLATSAERAPLPLRRPCADEVAISNLQLLRVGGDAGGLEFVKRRGQPFQSTVVRDEIEMEGRPV
jgi:hypothetical protein